VYHSLADLPQRVVPDCNVLLDAAFVVDGSARKSIDALATLGQSLLIEEMIQREAVRILSDLGTSLGLTFDPLSHFNSFLSSKPAMFVPPAPPLLGTGVNRADQHVAAAARHYNSWILTGDTPLAVEAEKVGLQARFPWDVILELAAQQGNLNKLVDKFRQTSPVKSAEFRRKAPNGREPSVRFYPLANFVRFVPPTRQTGLIFGRLIPGGWAGMKGVGKFTVCDIEHIGRIYYDARKESWIFGLVTGVEATVRCPVVSNAPIAVCGTYSRPGAGRQGRVTIRTGSFPSTSCAATKTTLTGLRYPGPGRITVCHTIENTHHWNGHLRTLVIGLQTMNRGTWVALIATREGAPNPYDFNALRHALRLVSYKRITKCTERYHPCPLVFLHSAFWQDGFGSGAALDAVLSDCPLPTMLSREPPFRFREEFRAPRGVLREEFRAPRGVRKSPRNEPAGHRRWSMGISVFG
jgi:hypothetical protein